MCLDACFAASGRHKAKSTGYFRDTQAGFLLDDDEGDGEAKKAKTVFHEEPGMA